jgi:colicin import membrane protein
MRPVEVTDAEVIQAGNDLLAANRNVTGFSLRKVVGGGSASRLRQVWDNHVNSQALSKAEPVAELPVEVAGELKELSDGLVQRLQNMAVNLNDKAVRAAERRVSDLVKSVGEQREQAERELADAGQAVDELEAQLDVAAQDKELLRVKLDEANAAGQKLAVEVAQLTERLASAERATKASHEQYATDIATAQKTIAGHVAEIGKMRDLVGAADTAAKQVDQLHGVALADVNGNSQSLAIELAQVRERLAAAEAGVKAAGEQFAMEAEKATKAREEAARYAGQVDAMERQVTELMAKVGTAPTANPG